MPEDVLTRPGLIALDAAERQRVHAHLAARGGHCRGCDGTEFDVGAALHLGFLFLDEESDAYLVALTCRTPDCGSPRTAIRLSQNELGR